MLCLSAFDGQRTKGAGRFLDRNGFERQESTDTSAFCCKKEREVATTRIKFLASTTGVVEDSTSSDACASRCTTAAERFMSYATGS